MSKGYMKPNYSTTDIITAADKKGSKFFQPSAMRFFSSRILSDAWRVGHIFFFVTSEQYHSGYTARCYTVRVFDGANVSTFGHFQRYANAYYAKRAAARAAHLFALLAS